MRTFIKLEAGNSVHYKHACNHCWRGPTEISGKEGQQVSCKHGGTYVCCHSGRLAFEHDNIYQKKKSKN